MQGQWHTRKGEDDHVIEHTAILAPDGAPDWVHDRQQLWNMVERREVNLTDGRLKENAQLFREVEITLPRELSREQRIELVEAYVQEQFVSQGMIADVAIHNRRASDGQEQPHAHIMLSLRRLETDEAKTAQGRFFGSKAREWNTPDALYEKLAEVKNRIGNLDRDIREFGPAGPVWAALEAAREKLTAARAELAPDSAGDARPTKVVQRAQRHVTQLERAAKTFGRDARLGHILESAKEDKAALQQQMPIYQWRAAWSQAANRALERAGEAARIDHRTLKAQRAEALTQGDLMRARELDREPQKPMGMLGRIEDAYTRLRENIHHYAAIEQRQKMVRQFGSLGAGDPVRMKQAMLRIQEWTQEVIDRFNRTQSDDDLVPEVRRGR